MLFNQTLEVYRISQSIPKNPFSKDVLIETPSSTIKGRISRQNVTVADGSVNKQASGLFRLYCDISEDVIKGDRVHDVLNNEDFLVDYVYKPNNHHIEADLSIVRKDI